MTLFPKSFFPSIADDSEREPIHSLVCDAAEIDPSDEEAGVLAVDAGEAIEAQNFPLDAAGEDVQVDYATAGQYYWATNTHDGYGVLVHVDNDGVATACWRR